MDILMSFVEKFGTWGLIVVVIVYIFLNSKFIIQYPRDSSEKK